jgi:hypothetical protein
MVVGTEGGKKYGLGTLLSMIWVLFAHIKMYGVGKLSKKATPGSMLLRDSNPAPGKCEVARHALGHSAPHLRKLLQGVFILILKIMYNLKFRIQRSLDQVC